MANLENPVMNVYIIFATDLNKEACDKIPHTLAIAKRKQGFLQHYLFSRTRLPCL